MAPAAIDTTSAAAAPGLGLTPDQLSFFRENGYLLIPDYLSRDEIDSLLIETHRLLDSFPLESHPLTRFTTGDDVADRNAKHVGDEYFLTSGDKVRFFFEPDAFSSRSTRQCSSRP